MAELLRIRTRRMELIAATVELIRAELTDQHRFSEMLKARVPGNEEEESWPPENVRDVMGLFSACLERDPDMAGWLNWYWVLDAERPEDRVLVGNGGFTSRPVDGTVATGYSILRQYQGCGYATEAVIALAGWALSHREVDKVIAEVEKDNIRSIRVLEKAGFCRAGKGSEEGNLLYVMSKEYL